MPALCIVGLNRTYDELVSRAASRLQQAYSPKARSAQMSHLTLFLQFSLYTGLPFPPSSSASVLAFIEFLQSNGLSPSSISACIHSLRSKFKALGLPPTHLSHHSGFFFLALTSLSLNVPWLRRVKGIFHIPALHSIISACLHLPLGFIYAPLFLLAFFAFLMLSNIVPSSPSFCSPLVHLCRGDVIFHPTFVS